MTLTLGMSRTCAREKRIHRRNCHSEVREEKRERERHGDEMNEKKDSEIESALK